LPPHTKPSYWLNVSLPTVNDSGAYSVVVDGLSDPGGTGSTVGGSSWGGGEELATSLSAAAPLPC